MEEKDVKSFQQEVSCLYGLDHPNILKLYHYFEDDKRYMIVTELIEGKELFTWVNNNDLKTLTRV